MATKKQRAKRAPKKRARKASIKLVGPIAAARLDFLEFLKKADPNAPELRR